MTNYHALITGFLKKELTVMINPHCRNISKVKEKQNFLSTKLDEFLGTKYCNLTKLGQNENFVGILFDFLLHV